MILNFFDTTKNYVKLHRNKLHLLIVIAELHCPSSPVYSQIFQYPVKVYMYIRMYVHLKHITCYEVTYIVKCHNYLPVLKNFLVQKWTDYNARKDIRTHVQMFKLKFIYIRMIIR